MTTPREIYTSEGVCISLDPNRTPQGEPCLQFSISEKREHQAWWSHISNLSADNVCELYDYLDYWINNTLG